MNSTHPSPDMMRIAISLCATRWPAAGPLLPRPPSPTPKLQRPPARLPLLAAACTLVCWPPAVNAEVDEVVEYRLLDTATLVGAAPVAWYRDGEPLSTPRGPAAATSWRIDWSVSTLLPAEGGCAVTNVRTRLAVLITLPRGDPSDATSQSQLDRLRLHEAGHLRIARAAARRVDAELSALPPLPDCRALRDEAVRRATAQIERSQQDHAAYDESTEHGRRQHDFQHTVSP